MEDFRIHYARTLESWLENCDGIEPSFCASFKPAKLRGSRSRTAMLAHILHWHAPSCSSIENGREWYVSHYLFRQRPRNVSPGGANPCPHLMPHGFSL